MSIQPIMSINKQLLFDSMVNREIITVQDHITHKIYNGVVNFIGIEDKSGSSFIIALDTGKYLYHRTID